MAAQWLELDAFTAGAGFNPWLGNEDSTSHAAWKKKKKNRKQHPNTSSQCQIHFYHLPTQER